MPISESEVYKLLHQFYGFKINVHGRGTNKSYVSWHWLYMEKILVPDVVSWNLPRDPNSFNPQLVASALGLDVSDFERAVARVYSQSCLLLTLFIYQIHRHLEIMGGSALQNLRFNYKGFLEANSTTGLGKQCCELLRKFRKHITEITDHPDTRAIGQELSKVIESLGCW